MQDFTGVPAVVDLAAMRDAMEDLGGDPAAINPLVDVDLVIDHSVQVDAFGNQRPSRSTPSATTSATASATPSCAGARRPSTTSGSCRRRPASATRSTSSTSASASGRSENDGVAQAYPDTLVGTDSHTTMINGLGVLGWGVGGIEAEAAMLGQPISMLLPQVIGFKLDRRAARGRDRDRPRADRDRDAAREGRRRQVRRVLRPGLAEPRPRRPGDDRQHVAGVRLDLRDLPDRRRDAPLPRVHRPPDRADRARRRLHARAGPLPRARRRGADLQRHARARPRRRRAQHRRPEAPAGPDRRSPTPSPPSSRRCRSGTRRPASSSATARDEAIAESFPASDPPAEDHDGDARQAAHASSEGDVAAERRADERRGRGRSSRAARRSSSTTATW